MNPPGGLETICGSGATLSRSRLEKSTMCRNIRPLFNFEPPTTDAEVRSASLQFVRKISGFTKPSQANEEAFARAVDEIAIVSKNFMQALETSAAPRNREQVQARAKARASNRVATPLTQ